MTPKQIEQFNRMHAALEHIAKEFMTPQQIERQSQRRYGLDYSEALEYSYDNIQATAKNALKGIRPIMEPSR